MTVPIVTKAISTTIRLTLKAILKLLSHDISESLQEVCARRNTGHVADCD
jgi:hypothetical protein